MRVESNNSIKYLLPYGREYKGIIKLGLKELAILSLRHNLPAIVITPTVNRNFSGLDKALEKLNISDSKISVLNSRNRAPIGFLNGSVLKRESIETIRKLNGKYVGFAFSCHEENIKKIEYLSCLEVLIVAAWEEGYNYFNEKWEPMLLNY